MDEETPVPTLFVAAVVLTIVVVSALVVCWRSWRTKYSGERVRRFTPSPSGHLIQDADESMIQVVRRFDPERGFRLTTYALWWIKTAIKEYLPHSWSLLRHGRKPHELFFDMPASGPFVVARPLAIPQLISHWVSHQTVEAANRDDDAEAQPPATAEGLPVDTVDVSVFSPPRVVPGAKFFIQAFVHERRDLVEMARLAARLDKSANRRGFATLRVEESFLALNRPEEMAFHAGFEGQRALRTWKDRMQRLAKLGFIGVKPGPLGGLSYAAIYNPYHVIKRAFLAGHVHENKWQALVVRANEVSAFDLDDIDDEGKLIVVEDEADDDDAAAAKPAPRRKGSAFAPKPRPAGRRARG
jgi:hypothetical protein